MAKGVIRYHGEVGFSRLDAAAVPISIDSGNGIGTVTASSPVKLASSKLEPWI
jgi:hypothetical protein